jgi:hypothetical protein
LLLPPTAFEALVVAGSTMDEIRGVAADLHKTIIGLAPRELLGGQGLQADGRRLRGQKRSQAGRGGVRDGMMDGLACLR